MAKFNPILGDLRGKVAGNVFSRNTHGAYVRLKVTPVNPRTNRQTAIRGFLATLSSFWAQSLTVVQRAAWIVYADNTPLSDVFGNEKILSGLNMYVRTNVMKLDAGQARADSAPAIFGEAPLAVILDPIGQNGFAITDSASTVPNVITVGDIEAATAETFVVSETGIILQMQFSPILSPGILFYNGPWGVISTFISDGVSSAFTFDFGATLAVGNVVFVRFRLVDVEGRVSADIVKRFVAVNIV